MAVRVCVCAVKTKGVLIVYCVKHGPAEALLNKVFLWFLSHVSHSDSQCLIKPFFLILTKYCSKHEERSASPVRKSIAHDAISNCVQGYFDVHVDARRFRLLGCS